MRARRHKRLRPDGDALFGALLESLEVPALACAADCRLIHANPPARDLIGASCAIGEHPETWMSLLQPRMLDGIAMPREDLPPVRALAGEVVRGVDVLVRIGDRDVALRVTARPVLDRKGRPRGAVMLIDAVSERACERETHALERTQPATTA